MSFLEEKRYKYKVEKPGERLDTFLYLQLVKYSREKIKKAIKKGNVKINDKIILKPAYRLKYGDSISLILDVTANSFLRPQDLEIPIIYEDEDIIVVNKPAGMLTHPTSNNKENTLVNALIYRFRQLSDVYGYLKPGIVHRLDKDTSGIILVAKNNFAHIKLAQQFRDRTVEKRYLAIVEGKVEFDEGVIKKPLARGKFERKKMKIDYSRGREAESYFRVLKRLHAYTFLLLYPRTGRTHQLRVHMKYYGHPLVGDVKYGKKSKLISRQALHAYYMKIKHPRKDKLMSFKADIPQDFRNVLIHLGITDYSRLLEDLKIGGVK